MADSRDLNPDGAGAGAGAGAGFPVTRWTLVGKAGGTDPAQQPVALAELVRMYAPALRAHLLQKTAGDEHRADDLLQGFLAEKVLEQQLIGHADPGRGRFRTFLLKALDRYVIDTHRRDTARKRSPAAAAIDVDEQRDTLASPREPAPADAMNIAWARQVTGEVLEKMRQECRTSNRPDLWTVFEVRYLKPATDNVEPEAHELIAARLHLESARQAANLLITSKRMFTRIFTSVVSRYAADQAEARAEVSELWNIFATAGDTCYPPRGPFESSR